MNRKVAFVCGGFEPRQDGVSAYVRRLVGALGGRIEARLVTRADWRLIDVVQVLLSLRRAQVDVLHVQYAPVAFRWCRSVRWLPPLTRCILKGTEVVVTAHEVDPNALGLLSGADAVITTTAEHTERIRGLYAPVQLIPIGPNIERAPGNPSALAAQARLHWNIPTTTPLVLFFGFLHPVKGLEYLIRALPTIRHASPGARLVLAGGWRSLALPGAEGDAYRDRLLSIALECKVADAVTITGYLEEPEVSALLFAADVVALPFTYGLSYKSGSLLAALSHTRPVVGTQAPLPDPRLEPDVHYVAVSPRDANALADATIRLLRDPSARARIATTGAQAAQPFNWPSIAQQHLDLYARLGHDRQHVRATSAGDTASAPGSTPPRSGPPVARGSAAH